MFKLATASLLTGLLLAAVPSSVSASPTLVEKSPVKTCPVGQVVKNTAKGKTCVKAAPVKYSTYKGPTVYGRLPFQPVLASGLSSSRIASEFAKDAASINNCATDLFPACAKKVWGRKDPWNLLNQGSFAAYDAPWAALFAKYAAAGVSVSHDMGDAFPGRYTNLDPTFSGVYILDFADGARFVAEYQLSAGSASRSSWLVPGCRFCSSYSSTPAE